MTDFNDTGAAPEPSTAPVAEPDYKALWEREKTDRQTERGRYRPFEQTIGALPPESQQALLSLAEAAANGDQQAVADWAASTYKNVTGADIANAVAARTTGQDMTGAATPPPTTPGPEYLTQDQARQMAQQEAENIVRRENLVSQIRTELNTAGYPSDSASGQAIISYAQQNRVPIAEAIQWFDGDLQAQWARRSQVLGQTASATPQPSPTGAPAPSQPQGTPAERALARLRGTPGA